MNTLYQALFPASLLPWAIIALFHFFNGYISLCVILLLHLSTHAIVILHKPVLNMDMVTWNRLLHMQRMALWTTYSFRNHWNQHFLSLILFLFIILNLKVLKRCERDITSEVLHTVCVLSYCSTTSFIPVLVGLGCIALYYFQKKPIKIHWQVQNEIEMYFNLRIAYNYLFAFIEWYASDMNAMSLLIILFVVALFNGAVYTQVPRQADKDHGEWFDAKSLPKDYPYPLNISDATAMCNTAKKLFKSHEI